MAPDDIDLMAEIELRLTNLSAHLPQMIDVAAIGVLDKAPYKALAVREALIWRVEELGRGAHQMFKQGDLASAILLTRGVVECTALMARLSQVIFERANMKQDELHDTLSRMLLGWKNEGPEFHEAFNVVGLLKHLDKRFGAVLRAYNHLSEFAHPNWGGVTHLFSRTDQENFVTYFGRFKDKTEGARAHGLNALAVGLAIFEHDYNLFTDTIEAWLPELEKFQRAKTPF